MPELRPFCAPLVAVLLAFGCASAPPAAPSLQTRIDAVVTRAPFNHAVWGVAVEDERGAALYGRNAHVLMMPASNRKLFSAATDAECLGLSTTLSTELWLDGEDVVIRGDGDPSFGSERHESRGFTDFVSALRSRGITHVRDVIADVSRFDRVTIPPSWKVGNLPSGYAAPVDALAFDENVSGEKSVADPALFTATNFRDALVLGGISVAGVPRVNTTTRAWQELVASVRSPTVYQLLTTVLKNSHNLYAEMLFKRSSPSGSYAESEDLESRFATAEAGVAADEMRFVDGCGLSPDDLVTPASILRVLRWMNAPERRNVWWTLLAEPGGEGTMRRRLTDLGPRLRGKTGSINGVNALSGIVRGSNGGYRYFSIVINHHLAETADALQVIDDIARAVAEF